MNLIGSVCSYPMDKVDFFLRREGENVAKVHRIERMTITTELAKALQPLANLPALTSEICNKYAYVVAQYMDYVWLLYRSDDKWVLIRCMVYQDGLSEEG